jgi:signal transduction histidine kinase
VSHDLRAPLRTIDGFAGLLVESLGADASAEVIEYAKMVRGGVERMNTLIGDLMRLSRTTQTELRRERVDLSAVASEIAARLQSTAPEREAEWRIEPDLVVEADLGLMRVVFENLLSNAWKYTGKVARARIDVARETIAEGEAVFLVRDNGAGFDMAAAENLFRPFRRLHSERDFPGTGIGLATVDRIIRRHGGRIWPDAAPGQGATFRFTLPSG